MRSDVKVASCGSGCFAETHFSDYLYFAGVPFPRLWRAPATENTSKTPRICFLRRIGRINAFAGTKMGKYGTPALVRFHIHLLQAVPWPFPSQTSFHTGSVSRDSVPLRQVRLPVALSTGVSGRDSSSGSIPHWQRFPRFGAVAASPSSSSSPGRLSGTDSSFGSFPHWQRFPRFGAVAACLSCSSSPGRLSGRDSSSGSIPHWQHILWFSAVAVNGLA